MALLKQPEQLAKMRVAGHIVAKILVEIEQVIAPGIRTCELDELVAQRLRMFGATSPFLNYPHHEKRSAPFPKTICVSVNEELVHGIPGKRVLRNGDIVSVDVGARVDGWVADAAWTFGVGKIPGEAQKLLDVTREALYRGIAAAKAGRRMGDIGWAIESYVSQHRFSVIRNYVGHGVGRQMHEEPAVPCHGKRGQGIRLQAGMTFALEPLVSLGNGETEELKDHWTVSMVDRTLSAQFEHTIAIHNGHAEVLTAL